MYSIDKTVRLRVKLCGILCVIQLFWISCNERRLKASEDPVEFTHINTDILSSDSISIRAMVLEGSRVWFAGNEGKYGYFGQASSEYFTGYTKRDTVQPEFRSIAQTSEFIFILSAGNPALLYRIAKDGSGSRLVYSEKGEKVFYDSMHFSSDTEGIAMGDPVNGCLSVLITRDGGLTWSKLGCGQLDPVVEGEAAFAASNSVLACQDGHWWMASGGTSSRVWHSSDSGQHWRVYNTPMVQGRAMTGIFTMDFYDKNRGMIAGGDYENQGSSTGNKAVTNDGGRTWTLVSDGRGPGYVSCLQYVPGSDAKGIVTVGATGVHFSSDGGNSWKKMSDEDQLYTIRFADDSTAYAAGRNKIVRMRLK